MTKTYYLHMGFSHVRYYWDPYLRLWTIYLISEPNEDGDQIGYASYAPTRKDAVIEALFLLRTAEGVAA